MTDIIFCLPKCPSSYRRGYAAETQKGLLTVEKLDYLQSKLLSGLFFALSKPLGNVGGWIIEVLFFFRASLTIFEWHLEVIYLT